MDTRNSTSGSGTSRRSFLKQTGGALTATAIAASIAPSVYAGEDNTIKVALVGCGGRGTGAAANALSTKGPVKLVAMADAFADRLNSSLQTLQGQFKDKVDVPEDRRFLGFDGYRKAIDLLGKTDVVLLTTPPAFRPIHLDYAVLKGVNVFMEKSFAVDGPGIRRVIKAGQAATEKNLTIAGGLMSRHSIPLEEAIKRIHDGMIGPVITAWAYREHGPVGFGARRAGESELAHQIRNYSNFTWVNGSFMLDWLIHNLDVCCWVKDAWPVSAQGHGGRQCRTEPDPLFDHYAVEYHFPDGTRLFAQGRHMNNCWNFFGDHIHGTTGCAVLGEGIDIPVLYKGHKMTRENMIWRFEGNAPSSYQHEHDLLFAAIRQNKPYNEAERCAKAAMVGILGRMAAESGQLITFEQALASNVELAPGLENITSLDSPAPVSPDANGKYPVAMPGQTKVV
jgi:predicted dehydrogenase